MSQLFKSILNFSLDFADFKITSKRSGVMDPTTDIPEIEVTFTNGIKQRMILSHYNAIPNSKSIDQSRICNYLGHLEGDETDSNVAVTGCWIGEQHPFEKMHITVLSRHSPRHKTFSVDSNGMVKHIEINADDEFAGESLKKDNKRDTSPWKPCGSDAFVNDLLEASVAAVTAEQETSVPSTLVVRFRLGYDKGVKQYFEGRGQNVDNWLAEVMTHAQAHYTHSSLQHKIIFEVRYAFIFNPEHLPFLVGSCYFI